ncbi:MAG: hypothetical protein ACI9YE_002998 [Psychroserpens sp.]|jgi:hypothetical protein
MTNENSSNNNQRPRIQINEDKGLAPVSSGTPMPKIKPAAPAPVTTSKVSSENKDS